MSASAARSIVAYRLSQSPTTPRRLNSSRWMPSHFSAYSRHSLRKATIGTSSLFLPFLRYSCSTCHSIGSPWQSQPGT
jgi:hypothetical protein